MSLPSLHRRLILTSLAALALAWTCLLAWAFWEMTRVGQGINDRDLRLVAQTLATLNAAELDDVTRTRLSAQLFDHFNAYDTPVAEADYAYRVSRADGRRLLASAQAGTLPALPVSAAPQDSGPWRSITVASGDGRVLAQVAFSQGYIRRALTELLLLLLLPLGLALPAVLAILAVATGRGLLPLKRLAEQLAARRRPDLSPVASPESQYRELMPLVRALNELLARLAAHRDQERHFFADAAHELRTPLAALSAQAHVLAHAQVPEERADALARLNAGIARNAELLGRLLSLSRLDSEEPPALAPLDLAALAQEALARQLPRALTAGMELAYEGPAQCLQISDESALASLLGNLLDNALRYCPVGSQVVLRLDLEGEKLHLAVLDDGPGIPPEWRERALQRFQRLPGTEAQGSGLGLAIVQALATRLGAELSLSDGLNGRGLGVHLRLPLAPASSGCDGAHAP
ncbi:MAG: histidine kinase [Gammaproteobacteria bacterium]|nr:histidine kinase [Gammaproteobacteria bacterium]